MNRLVFGSASLLLSLQASVAQEFLGLSHNAAVGAASRGSIGSGSGEVMTRLDGVEAAGWGLGTPGFRTVSSIACVVQDLNAATAETFAVRLYPEDPGRLGFPDLGNGVDFALAVPGPTGTGGQAAMRVVTPAAPVLVPIRGTGGVFVAFELPAATAGDGLSMQVVLGFDPGNGFTTFDVPGPAQGAPSLPAAGPANSHFLSRSGATLTYNPRRQCWLDLEHDGAGGSGLTITNQTSYPSSNEPAPAGVIGAGTGDLLSGSAPDIAGANVGRADDLGMWYRKSGLGSGRLVVFLVDYDFTPNWAPELPVAALLPGARGSLCLVDPQIVTFVASAQDEAWYSLRISTEARSQLPGLVLKQQAVGLLPDGTLHASPCDAMRF